MRPSQGNVLFLILIAVALFAALSYAVTQSSRGGGNADKERQSLTASRLLQYGTSLQQAITRMRVINGCSETDISFAQAGDAGDYDHTPLQPDRCRVFHEDGGGATSLNTDDFFGSGGLIVMANGISGLGIEGNSELLLFLSGMTAPDLCLAVNDLVGIMNPSGAPPVDDGHDPLAGIEFSGSYADGIVGNQDFLQNTTSNEIQGHPVGCYANTASTAYYFYFALIER